MPLSSAFKTKPGRHVFVYVHGTNGSGKSTLARCIIAAAGGATGYRPSHTNDRTAEGKRVKVGTTHTARGVYLLGKYDRACGGVDGISPYAYVKEETRLRALNADARVFAEGLVTPGVDTCQTLAGYFDRHLFIVLMRPEAQCLANVQARRDRRGNDKPYTGHDNLRKKLEGAQHWGDRLERAGLSVQRLEFWDAYRVCLQLLSLPSPSISDLL